jgi:hypothetical protein
MTAPTDRDAPTAEDMAATIADNWLPAPEWSPLTRKVLAGDIVAAIEAESARLRERVAELEAALLGVADDRQFGPCWCDTMAGMYCVGQEQCRKAKEATDDRR